MHHAQDEWWYVLEGEFIIRVGEETWTCKAGDSAFGPRGIPHTFAKIGEGSARLLIVFQPAGRMEEWFHQVSDGTIGKLSEAEQTAQRKAHGFERSGPAIDYLKKY